MSSILPVNSYPHVQYPKSEPSPSSDVALVEPESSAPPSPAPAFGEHMKGGWGGDFSYATSKRTKDSTSCPCTIL